MEHSRGVSTPTWMSISPWLECVAFGSTTGRVQGEQQKTEKIGEPRNPVPQSVFRLPLVMRWFCASAFAGGRRLRMHYLLVLLCFQVIAVLATTLKQDQLLTTVELWSKWEGVWQGPNATVDPSNVVLWADFNLISTASKSTAANSTATYVVSGMAIVRTV